MKKLSLLFVLALSGLAYVSCEDDEKLEAEQSKKITLTAPESYAEVDLATVSKVSFKWGPQGDIDGYRWLLSDAPNLANAVTKPATSNPFDLSAAELDRIMAENFGIALEAIPTSYEFYWTVISSAGDVKAGTRAISLKRLSARDPVITLVAPETDTAFALQTTPSVTFRWQVSPAGAINEFVLALSDNESDFAGAATFPATASSFTLTVSDLDDILKSKGVDKGQTADLYWKVLSANTKTPVTSTVRAMSITRMERATISLTSPVDGTEFDLATDEPVNFAWATFFDADTITHFVLQISDAADLSGAVSYPVTGSKIHTLTATAADDILKNMGVNKGDARNLYYSVKPLVDGLDVSLDTLSINVKRVPQPVVSPTAPDDNAAFYLASFTDGVNFTWSAVPANSYGDGFTLLVSANLDLSSPVVTENLVTSPHEVTPADLNAWATTAGAADGAPVDLYWSVQPNGTFDPDNTPATYVRKLTVTRPPSTPVINLTAPANNVTFDLLTHTANVNISWATSAGGNITAYKLLVSTNSDLSSPTVTEDPVTSPHVVTAAELDQLASTAGVAEGAQQTFYWSVVPSNGAEPATTFIRSFTVKRAAPVITLTGPATGQVIDLGTATNVTFTWDHLTGASPYKLTWSAFEDLDLQGGDEVENITGASQSIPAVDMVKKLLAMNNDGSTNVNVYWKVEMQTSNTTIARPSATGSFKVNIPPVLTTPATNAALTLDYKNPAVTAVTFSWLDLGDEYELLFSKNANMSNPVVVPVTGTSQAYTHAELQTALIGTAVAPKKYKTNTVYWSVRVAGETSPLTGVTPRTVKVGGYRIFEYPNSSANTYEVSVVTLSGNKAGQETVWLSTNFRESHDKNGVAFTTTDEAIPATDHSAMPAALRPTAGYYYFNNHPEQPLLKGRLLPQGWELPSQYDFDDLWAAAVTQAGSADVLLTIQSNTWNLNLGGYGNLRWGAGWIDMGGVWDNLGCDRCFVSAYDYEKTIGANPWPYTYSFVWDPGGTTSFEPGHYIEVNYGAITVRGIYVGDDNL
ncbi:MAG: SusE domain-containing protein [Prevotellaceae bacterium]|jgi:hypothetical protein|nr:SusE domain-containing protein [Prevotellaceae bacterium]